MTEESFQFQSERTGATTNQVTFSVGARGSYCVG